MHAHRTLLISALLLLLLAAPAVAAEPWETPFTDDTAALLKAAEAIDSSGKAGGHVLIHDIEWSFDEQGRRTRTSRIVTRILDLEGVSDWGQVYATWSPWYQHKAEVRGRVIKADGAVVDLDPDTLMEARLQGDVDIYWDRRTLEGPIPGLGVGSIIETQVRTREHRLFFEAGTVNRTTLAADSQTERLRLSLEHPKSLAVKLETEQLGKTRPKKVADGRLRYVWDLTPPPDFADFDPYLPREQSTFPSVAFATGASWKEVARAYSAVVEEQLVGVDLAATAAEITDGVTRRDAVVQSLTTWVQHNVFYTGLELGENALVPVPPPQTVERGFGDCKDQSTLLVGLLRASGIDAHVALLRSGGRKHPPDLPGLGMFDHAIVYVSGDEPLWIDPTNRFARAGRMAPMLEGKLALVATEGTRGLVPIAGTTAADNGWIEIRELTIEDEGLSTLVETSTYRGWPEASLREGYAGTSDEARRDHLARYVDTTYGGELVSFEVGDPDDLTAPLGILMEAKEVTSAWADADQAFADLPYGALFAETDAYHFEVPEGEEPKETDTAHYGPHQAEVRWVVRPPPGYVPEELPEDRQVQAGPAAFSATWTAAEDGVVTVSYRFVLEGDRFTPEELAALREGMTELSQAPVDQARFILRSRQLADSGDLDAALAELRSLPQDGLTVIRTAELLLEAGLGEPAILEARRAVEIDPEQVRSWRSLAWLLQHDPMGRRFGQGWDRPGAIEAYGEVIARSESDYGARANLAIVLEYDELGTRYSVASDLPGAVEHLRRVTTDWDDPEMEDLLLIDLFRLGRWGELLEAGEIGSADIRRPLRVAARSAKDGATAAVSEARRLSTTPQGGDELVAAAYLELLEAGAMQESADLGMAMMAQLGGTSPAMERAIEVMEKAAAWKPPEPPYGPTEVVVASMLASLDPRTTAEEFMALVGAPAEDDGGLSPEIWQSIQRGMRADLDLGKSGIGVETALALGLSAMEIEEEVLDPRTRQVSLSVEGVEGSTVFLTLKSPDGWRAIGGEGMWTFTGDEAASRLARGKTARAHELLARVYELDNEHGEPSMKQFSAVWEQQDGGAEGLALSAAVLQCTVPQAVCMDVIDELAPSVADEELRRALYSTVIWSRADFRDWEGAERSSRRWLEASPMVAEAGIVLHRTLLAQGRHDEASQLRGEMAAWEEPPEASTLRSLEQAERIAADDLRGAMEVAAAAPDADTDLYLLNSRAWYAALLGDVDEATLELARKGAESGRSAPLHTLATVLVELERPKEARSALLKSMARGGRQVPDSDDWYVLGRMAELYGCPDAARLAYERVQDDHSPLTRPESTWILAARRLEALAAP